MLKIEREEEENKKNIKDKKENRLFAECNNEKYKNLIILIFNIKIKENSISFKVSGLCWIK